MDVDGIRLGVVLSIVGFDHQTEETAAQMLDRGSIKRWLKEKKSGRLI